MVWLRSISGHFHLLYSFFCPPPPNIVLLIPLDAGEIVQEWSFALKQKGQSLEAAGTEAGAEVGTGHSRAEAGAEAEARICS